MSALIEKLWYHFTARVQNPAPVLNFQNNSAEDFSAFYISPCGLGPQKIDKAAGMQAVRLLTRNARALERQFTFHFARSYTLRFPLKFSVMIHGRRHADKVIHVDSDGRIRCEGWIFSLPEPDYTAALALVAEQLEIVKAKSGD